MPQTSGGVEWLKWCPNTKPCECRTLTAGSQDRPSKVMALQVGVLRPRWSRTSLWNAALLVYLAILCSAIASASSGSDLAKDHHQEVVVYTETNLFELVDDILPPERQCRVWSSDTGSEQHGKYRRRHEHRKPGKPNQATSSAAVETSRQRRSPILTAADRGSRKQPNVRCLMQNAFPRTTSVDLTLVSARDGNRYRINQMYYGDWRVADLPLSLDDTLIVADENERYSQKVRNKLFKVPAKAECFIVPDQTIAGHLHSSITIYDLDVPFSPKKSWLMTYNAMLRPTAGRRVLHGVDVIIFDASKFKLDFSLHRIARNISLHTGQESLVPAGNYELKVIPHGQAADVTQFKNVQSLLPPTYIKLEGGMRHYVTLQGVERSEKFSPRLESVPPIQTGAPQETPTSSLIALNAYGQANTKIEFPRYNVTINLASGRGVEQVIHLRRGDIFNVTTNSGQRYGFIIRAEVPYQDGECALIPDRSRTGKLEAFFACWYRFAKPLSTYQFWIFSYHAMLGYDQPLDWILFDETALNDTRRHALFSIADKLYLTHGISARTDVGNYSLKVVPHGTVDSPESFRRAESVIEPTFINPQPLTRYYAAIQGNYGKNKKGVFMSYPPMPAVAPPTATTALRRSAAMLTSLPSQTVVAMAMGIVVFITRLDLQVF